MGGGFQSDKITLWTNIWLYYHQAFSHLFKHYIARPPSGLVQASLLAAAGLRNAAGLFMRLFSVATVAHMCLFRLSLNMLHSIYDVMHKYASLFPWCRHCYILSLNMLHSIYDVMHKYASLFPWCRHCYIYLQLPFHEVFGHRDCCLY